MIEETDRSVGVIIRKLEELKLRKNTLVLFISDNGGLSKYTSNQPLRGEKCNLYEGGIRVPMIASMPGYISAGTKCDTPVSGIDFYPTICRLMNVKATDPSKVDGDDLSDLIFNVAQIKERNLFWNFPVYNRPSISSRCPRSAMRRGDWKIIHRYEERDYELYNLREDIGESNDLSTSNPKELARMKNELNRCYKRFNATDTLAKNTDYNKATASAEREKTQPETRPTSMSTAQAYIKFNLY